MSSSPQGCLLESMPCTRTAFTRVLGHLTLVAHLPPNPGEGSEGSTQFTSQFAVLFESLAKTATQGENQPLGVVSGDKALSKTEAGLSSVETFPLFTIQRKGKNQGLRKASEWQN